MNDLLGYFLLLIHFSIDFIKERKEKQIIEVQLDSERKRNSMLELKLAKTKGKVKGMEDEVRNLQRKHDANWSPKRELERSSSYGMREEKKLEKPKVFFKGGPKKVSPLQQTKSAKTLSSPSLAQSLGMHEAVFSVSV